METEPKLRCFFAALENISEEPRGSSLIFSTMQSLHGRLKKVHHMRVAFFCKIAVRVGDIINMPGLRVGLKIQLAVLFKRP